MFTYCYGQAGVKGRGQSWVNFMFQEPTFSFPSREQAGFKIWLLPQFLGDSPTSGIAEDVLDTEGRCPA